MKAIKVILYAAMALLVTGIILKAVEFPGGIALIGLGCTIQFLTCVAYILVALVTKSERSQAAVVGLIGAFAMGYFFKMMHWPGAGMLLVVSNGALLITSLTLAVFSFTNKRPLISSMGLLVVGFGVTFIGIRTMHWPLGFLVFIPFGISSVVWIYGLIKAGRILNYANVLVALVILAVTFVYVSKRHSMYRFQKIALVTDGTDTNFPFAYYQYAWYLNLDGKTGEALQALDNAEKQLKTEEYVGGVDLELVDQARDKIKAGRWRDFETRMEVF